MWEWGVNPTKQPHNQWEDERTIRSAAAQEFLPELQSFLAPIKAQLIFRIVPENLVYRPLDVTWEGRRGFDFYAWRYRLPKVAIDQIENLLLSIKTAYDNHEAYRSALEQEKHTLETAIQEYKRHNPYPDTELAARKAERAINAFLNASPSQEQQYLDVLIDLIEKPIQKAPIAYAKTAFEAWLTLKEQFKSYLLGAISAWHLDYPFMAMNFPYDAAVSNPQNPLILLGVRNPANGRLYSDQELEAQLNKLLVEQHTCFMNFIRELKSVLGALAANPILADSGEEEVIYRPGPVRPYQDIKNDIANQLSGLPSFTARVKISGNSPQNPGKKCLNCGRQSNSATAKFCQGCGTRLPAPNEYTITTLKPAVGIGTQQLQQRIARIQARNVQDGYLSERVKVEAEILQRQQSCSSSPPAHPQLPPQQPRHARQVPVQGSCPNCGKSNPPGSKFCNQCGTKL